MSRQIIEWRNWTEITIPYSGDWRKHHDFGKYLERYSEHEHKILVSTKYPDGHPKKRPYKVISHYHYYLKKQSDISFAYLTF